MTSRTATIPKGETRGQRACRAQTVARMQASAQGRRNYYEPGEQIGIHRFAGYVGDNPEGLYIYWECGRCGHKSSIKRDQVSTLRVTKGCVKCNRKNLLSCQKAQAAE